MDKIELKPCPFCGSDDIDFDRGTNRKSTNYSCNDCGCSLETGETWHAPKAWNQRHEPEALGDGEIEDLVSNLSRTQKVALIYANTHCIVLDDSIRERTAIALHKKGLVEQAVHERYKLTELGKKTQRLLLEKKERNELLDTCYEMDTLTADNAKLKALVGELGKKLLFCRETAETLTRQGEDNICRTATRIVAHADSALAKIKEEAEHEGN